MLTLNDGRSELWQWDTGRTLAVDADCSQVHFSNKVFGRSIDVDVVDGKAIIPDVLLQTDKDLNVWAFVGTAENGYTKISKTFKVNRRNKPADYVFTPVEQTTIAEIAAIAQSVRDDADAGLFDGKPGENGRDGVDGKDGAPGKDGISATHSLDGTVLTITSASGTSSADLKGDKGDTGEQGPQGPKGETGTAGADGKTPEYGVDYGTPEQISDIAQKAAEILRPDVNQIKYDLANKLPKSPADWESWTAEEQAAARDRMGLPGEWELIEETTITEEITVFERATEPNGNPYNFVSVVLQVNFAGIPSDIEYNSSVYTVIYNNKSLYDYFKNRKIERNSSLWSYVDCSGKCPNFNSFIANNTGASVVLERIGFINTFANDSKCRAEVINNVHASGLFPAGVKFTIWGVRA